MLGKVFQRKYSSANFKKLILLSGTAILLSTSSMHAMESQEEATKDSIAQLSKRRALPLPPKKVPPSPSLHPEALQHKNRIAVLEQNPKEAVKKARQIVDSLQGTKDEDLLVPYLNLAELLSTLAISGISGGKEVNRQALEEAQELYGNHLFSMYEHLQAGHQILDEQSRNVPLPTYLKEQYFLSGSVAKSLGDFDEAIERFESALALIDDNPNSNPQHILLGLALSAWSAAHKSYSNDSFNLEESQRRYFTKAAAYFEAYFKLNPKNIDLDYYVKASQAAWVASQVPLEDAWTDFENMRTRLTINYNVGPFNFMDHSGPFVPDESREANWNTRDEFFYQLRTSCRDQEKYEIAQRANHVYQAHLRRLAKSWMSKVSGTEDVTRREELLETQKLYEALKQTIQASPIDDSTVDLRPEGYVSYEKPTPERYVGEAILAIENESNNYATFLAERLLQQFGPAKAGLPILMIKNVLTLKKKEQSRLRRGSQ